MLQISRTNERPVNNNLCFKYVQKQLKMKTIAIIDDDIHIGDMLAEILTRTEYAILKLLMTNPTQVIAKSVLLDRISIDTPDCTERSLK